MDDILILAEHEPTPSQVEQVLDHLEAERGKTVTALLHHHPPRTPALMDGIAGAHGLPAQAVVREMHAEHAWDMADARRRLSHVVGLLRAAGHPAYGELVAGPLIRVLVHEVRDRGPEVVMLLTNHRRLARMAHLDLERRLRHHSSARVEVVMDVRHPHQV